MLKEELSSGFHDAELVSVEIKRLEKKILLGFIRVNGIAAHLSFSDVVSFRINDLNFQNVVSRLIVSTEIPLDDKEIIQWVKWIHSSNETQPVITSDAIGKYLKQIKNNELILFVMEPSWGAEGAVICRSIN